MEISLNKKGKILNTLKTTELYNVNVNYYNKAIQKKRNTLYNFIYEGYMLSRQDSSYPGREEDTD